MEGEFFADNLFIYIIKKIVKNFSYWWVQKY